MTLKAKIRRYKQLKAQIPQLEREIRLEAEPILRAEGNLAMPRMEKILARFAM